MSLDTTTLQTNLTTRLAALDGTETFEAVLSLTAAIDNLTTNRFISVATYEDLPNLTTTPLPSGSLIFVEEFNIMMMSVGTQWKGIDGRAYIPAVTIAYGWGNNNQGAVGDNTTTARSSPVTVVGGITNWSQLGESHDHSVGITSAGIAYAWGLNLDGRLGDGTTTNRSSPVTVVGGITTWSQVSAGTHTLGLTSAGILYAWGRGIGGTLGNNAATARSSPVTVVGGITTWTQVSTGRYSSVGITSAGIAYAWGYGSGGRLGDNTTTNKSSPVTVVGGITTWSQVSAGAAWGLGRTSAGIAYAWGRNDHGQLGDNTGTSKSSPVTVVGGITTWSQVFAARYHGLGITSGGVAYAWGQAGSGQLGNNATTARSSPVTVVGGVTNWSKLAGGSTHSLGITSAGIAYAWGAAGEGRLGDNTTTGRSSPVTIFGGLTGWTSVSGGTAHSVGLRVA
jgi:alpha-tubulin suppressor-like RCC1 family protein